LHQGGKLLKDVPWGHEYFAEKSVEQQVIVESRLVADGAEPLGLLLVHLQVEVSVEALQVVAGRRATRHCHSHFT